MKRLMSLATIIGALTIVTTVTASAAAQDFNVDERTYLTFSAPVELPGTRLPAGTYVFRIANPASKSVVQVLSEDGEKVLGQWLFVPAERQEATGETLITFGENSSGSAPAIQYWYYPGDRIGKEFIYPEDQAMQIATRYGVVVMTEAGPVRPGATAGAAATTGTVEIDADEDEAEIEIERHGVETEIEIETER